MPSLPVPFPSLFLLLLLPLCPLASFNSPCQLPPSPSKLVPFCQFPYHQVPFICDPGGILSRTEAELIDRRLWPNHNLTGCLCLSRPCAQKDRQNGKIRALALLVQSASIEGIRKCKEKGQNWESELEGEGRRRRRGTAEFASLAGQFARMALERAIGQSSSRERCDPDLFVIYIGRWGEAAQGDNRPFIVRIFRRNLAHLRDLSQVERVDRVGASPFEILLEHLGRALHLANPRQSATPKPLLSSQFPFSPSPIAPSAHANQIPSWAILSGLFFVLLALFALLLAHWIGRRISLVSQKKFSTASRMSTRSTRTEDMPMQGKGAGGHGHSSLRGVTFGGLGAGGGGGGASASHLKSQMMFRQFSRKTPQASLRTVQSQKI